MRMPTWPNFLVIGAGKSGTTSLYEYFNQHPEMFMSQVKETNFFALEGQTVKPQDDSPEQTAHYPWSITNEAEYIALFNGVSHEKAIGEVSPMYLYNERAPRAIKARIPDVKLIAILRQPAERLYSRYMHLVREGRAPSDSFEDALDRDTIWWRRNDLVTEGFYGQYIKRYLEIFPRHQIKVVLYDDFRNKQQETLKELYQFLGVAQLNLGGNTVEQNKSGKIKNQLLNQVIGQKSPIISGVRKTMPGVVKGLKNSRLVNGLLTKMRNGNLEKAPLAQNLKKEITDNIYKEDILLLEQLTGKNLKHWLV